MNAYRHHPGRQQTTRIPGVGEPMTPKDQIAAYIAKHGVERCPPGVAKGVEEQKGSPCLSRGGSSAVSSPGWGATHGLRCEISNGRRARPRNTGWNEQ